MTLPGHRQEIIKQFTTCHVAVAYSRSLPAKTWHGGHAFLLISSASMPVFDLASLKMHIEIESTSS